MVFTTWGPTQNHGWGKYYGAVMRYVMEPPVEYYLERFQYFYIGDVDLFILRSEPTLMDYHLQSMAQTGQCYSNARGSRPVTGLHFAHISWFERTKEAREKYYWKLRQGEIGNIVGEDEHTLASIITESGMPLPARDSLIRRHFGIHAGAIRGMTDIDAAKKKLRVRITADRAERWRGIVNTQEYRSIFNKINNVDRQIAWELHQIEKFCCQKCNEKV